MDYAGDVGFFENKCKLPIGTSKRLVKLAREIAGGETAGIKSLLKVDVERAFKAGIKYTPPDPLLSTSGVNWVYQPHTDLYKTLATNVLKHYNHYKRDKINKTYIPSYFYLGGAGTGKSRYALEFASSV